MTRPRAQLAQPILDRPWAMLPASLRRLAAEAELEISRGPGDLEAFASQVEAASFRERVGVVRAGAVDVVPVYGVITQRMTFMTWLFGGTAVDYLREALRESVADPEVGAIVLDVDSPGGSVDGLTELAADLREIRAAGKPLVAVANPQATSAAEWIIAQASEVVVTPSGAVGSIGVYSLHQDISRALDAEGVTITLISAGPHKVEGNPFEPLQDEARATIQAEVDHFYGMFLADVGKGRGVTPAQVAENFGGGRMLLPQDALKAGMVDRIDTLESTIRRVGRVRPPAATNRSATAPALDGIAAGDPAAAELEPAAPSADADVSEPGTPAAASAEPTPPTSLPVTRPARVAASAADFDRAARGAGPAWHERTTPPWTV